MGGMLAMPATSSDTYLVQKLSSSGAKSKLMLLFLLSILWIYLINYYVTISLEFIDLRQLGLIFDNH